MASAAFSVSRLTLPAAQLRLSLGLRILVQDHAPLPKGGGAFVIYGMSNQTSRGLCSLQYQCVTFPTACPIRPASRSPDARTGASICRLARAAAARRFESDRRSCYSPRSKSSYRSWNCI